MIKSALKQLTEKYLNLVTYQRLVQVRRQKSTRIVASLICFAHPGSVPAAEPRMSEAEDIGKESRQGASAVCSGTQDRSQDSTPV